MPFGTITSTENTFGSLDGTVNCVVPGTLTGSVGVPGAPGVGVPTGGTAGQFLTKTTTGVDYATGWTTLSLAGYATESWVTAGFYPLVGNPSGFLTSSALTPYLQKAGGTITGDIQSNNNSAYRSWDGAYNTTVLKGDYLQLTNSDIGGNALTVEWNGITFPSGKQTVHYPGASILSGYATESWTTSNFAPIAAGQPTSGTVGQVLTKQSGTSYDSAWATLIPGDRYLTSSTTSLTIDNANKTLTVGTGLSYSSQQDIVISYDATHHMHAQVLTYNSGTGVMTVDVLSHTGTGTFAAWTVNVGGTTPLQSVYWGEILGTLGDQTDLATALNAKLETSGGALTGSVTNADATYDSEFAGWGLGVQQSSDHTKGTTVEFNGLDTYDGASHMQVTPTGLTFPDASVQTTAFTGSSFAAWGSITGTLSAQTDLQNALDAKYDASNPSGFITQGTADGLYYSISNPSGFITSGDLAGYATESFVTSQGYITASALTGYATESWVQSQGYLYPDANGVIQYPNGVMTDPAFPVGRFWYQSQKFRWTDGVAIRTVASESYVTTALGSYAPLAGATFTGKVNTVAPTSTNAGINIGSINSTANLTNSVAGDVWIGTWQMAYKTANGTLIYGAATNASNVFGSPQIIDTTNATPALRVTQKGTGNVLLVEDSLNPDATALVVEANGNVGIGVATGYTATQKVEVVGNVKADAFINGTGPTYNVKAIQAHSGGSDTHELLVSVNGSTYRVGMKFVSTP